MLKSYKSIELLKTVLMKKLYEAASNFTRLLTLSKNHFVKNHKDDWKLPLVFIPNMPLVGGKPGGLDWDSSDLQNLIKTFK